MLPALFLIGALAPYAQVRAPAQADYGVRVVLAGKTDAQIRFEVVQAAEAVCLKSRAIPNVPLAVCTKALVRETMALVAARKTPVTVATK